MNQLCNFALLPSGRLCGGREADAAAGQSTGASTRRVRRSPDGTGPWSVPPGNSQPDTESGTNDDLDVPGNEIPPDLTVSDASAPAGQDLVFTLSLDEAKNFDVTFDVAFIDISAQAGTDYAPPLAGPVTIPAGATSIELVVSSFPNGAGVFHVSLSGAARAVITRQIGRGLIIPEATAEWRFDEFSWGGDAGRVRNASGSSLHGTAMNGAHTSSLRPVVEGSPGTCHYGSFDGLDDYVSVPHDPALNFTDGLTITAWVKPSGTGLRTVVAKGSSFALQVNSSNQLAGC